MIKFEHTKVVGFEDAIRGMRNSWESWDKSDSGYKYAGEGEDRFHQKSFVLGENDHKLAMTLSKAGNDHAKYLRQICVWVDITAPEKWWSEFDTYKVGTVANSTSMMHTLGNRPLTKDDFSFEDLNIDLKYAYLTLINEARELWIKEGKKKPSREWRQMLMLMAVGFNYRRTVTMNYQVLKNIYHSRKNHRLSEWHTFCDWIESLPYSELITLKEVI